MTLTNLKNTYYRTVCLGLTSVGASALIVGLAAVPAFGQQSVTTQTISVTAEPVATPHRHDDTPPKLEHSMREVNDTEITVTKKATVIPLEKQAPNEGNNLQELFTKARGLIVSKQQNPGQFKRSAAQC